MIEDAVELDERPAPSSQKLRCRASGTAQCHATGALSHSAMCLSTFYQRFSVTRVIRPMGHFSSLSAACCVPSRCWPAPFCHELHTAAEFRGALWSISAAKCVSMRSLALLGLRPFRALRTVRLLPCQRDARGRCASLVHAWAHKHSSIGRRSRPLDALMSFRCSQHPLIGAWCGAPRCVIRRKLPKFASASPPRVNFLNAPRLVCVIIAHLPLLPVAPVNSWRTPHSLSHGRAPASRRMRGAVGGGRG